MKRITNRKNCVVHCRVSTPKQVAGDGLDDQAAVARLLTEREGWRRLKVFKYPYSASTVERRDFDEIIDWIKTSPEPVHFYVCRAIDRFTRAGVEEYLSLRRRLEEIGVQFIDTTGLVQPLRNSLEHLDVQYHWSVYSPSETAELMEAARANTEIRHILTRMVGAEVRLYRDGYQVRRPLDGYKHRRVEVGEKMRVIAVPDEQRAKYYRRMFEMRASGRYSDQEIVKRVNAMGFRSKPHKIWDKDRTQVVGASESKPLTCRQLRRSVANTEYCGVRAGVWTKGKPVPTKAEALVSIDLFNRANKGKIEVREKQDGTLRLIRGAAKRRQYLRSNPLYVYKSVVLCDDCRKPFLTSASRGRHGKTYPAYHCNRGHYIRVPKADFEGLVDAFLGRIRLRKGFFDELETCMASAFTERRSKEGEARQSAQTRLRELESKQASLAETLPSVESPTARRLLEEKIDSLEAQKDELEAAAPGIGFSEHDLRGFVEWARREMEPPFKLLKEAENTARQAGYARILFGRLPTYSEIKNGTAELSPLFESDAGSDEAVGQFVTPQSVEWNQIEETIGLWRLNFTGLE